MKKRLLLVLVPIILLIIALIAFAMLKNKANPSVKAITSTVETTSIDGQIDFIQAAPNNIQFLTYRATAVAKIDETNKIKVVTDQVLPQGIISDLVWLGSDKFFLEMVNDPNGLADITNYQPTSGENVYAVFDIKTSSFSFLPSGPSYVFPLDNSYFGIENNKLVKLKNGGWQSTNLALAKENLLLSSTNKLFGIYNKGSLKIYDSSLNEVSTAATKTISLKNLRLFDSGTFVEVVGTKLYLTGGEKTKTIEVTKNDNLLFGENSFLYTNKGTVYLYRDSKEEVAKTDLPKNLTFLDIYGLSEAGALYMGKADPGESVERWEFKD